MFSMPRPKYDKNTVESLLKVLVNHPDGVWLSKLAKEADIPISTTAYYMDNQLSDLVFERSFGDKKPVIRVISLRPRVLESLKKGVSFDRIVRLMKIISGNDND